MTGLKNWKSLTKSDKILKLDKMDKIESWTEIVQN